LTPPSRPYRRPGLEPKTEAASKDRVWFERKAAGLKAELEKLPTDRQEQLRSELEDEPEREQ
jgi:hypothetical protein